MMRRPLKILTVWLTLAIFAVSGAVMPCGFALCQDSHGTRFEFGCERNGQGHCETSFASAHPTDAAAASGCGSHGCRDIAVSSVAVASRGEQQRLSPPTTIEFSAPIRPAVAGPDRSRATPAAHRSWLPPPAAAHLRSVVLLV